MKPSGFTNSLIMEQMTTVEIKCGIYVIVWVTRANFLLRSSFIKSASMMGAGKPNTIVARLIFRVLPNNLLK